LSFVSLQPPLAFFRIFRTRLAIHVGQRYAFEAGRAEAVQTDLGSALAVCDGTDADTANCGDPEFSPNSTACCNACGHWATVAAFTAEVSS